MLARTLLLLSLWVPVLGGSIAAADEVRYVQEGGVTYREERRIVQKPVVETRLEARQQTVYREQLSTEVHPVDRTVYTPVTEYRWEARWHNTWNPFSSPYVGYHLVPSTRWEGRNEKVQQTITKRDLVPQTSTIQVPVTTQRVVNEEYVTRTAVSAAPAPIQGVSATLPTDSSTAQSGTIGGISKLDNDPPR